MSNARSVARVVLLGWVLVVVAIVLVFRHRFETVTILWLDVSAYGALLSYGYFVKRNWKSRIERTEYRGFAVVLIFMLFLLYASVVK